jgi:hypothetical protein
VTQTQEAVEAQLKAAVQEGEKNFPGLHPWQQVLFREEVVPQFQRFIKDYRPTDQGGVKVEVDYQSIRQYLTYYGPKALRLAQPKILVNLKSDPNCAKCAASSVEIQTLIRSRLEKRGFTPIWLTPDDFSSQITTGDQDEQILSLMKKRNASGALVVQWSPAPDEDPDSAHADEKRYIIRTSLQVGELSVRNQQKELMDNDSFENTEARLLTDIFADLGAKYELEEAAQVEGGREEILIQVSGIRDFAQYSRIKNTMQTQLKDIFSLEDRKLSKEQVTFAIFTKQTSDSLRKQLAQINLDPESTGGQPVSAVVQ